MKLVEKMEELVVLIENHVVSTGARTGYLKMNAATKQRLVKKAQDEWGAMFMAPGDCTKTLPETVLGLEIKTCPKVDSFFAELYDENDKLQYKFYIYHREK